MKIQFKIQEQHFKETFNKKMHCQLKYTHTKNTNTFQRSNGH